MRKSIEMNAEEKDDGEENGQSQGGRQRGGEEKETR